MEFWTGYNGQQSGDPTKHAQALIKMSGVENPPSCLLAGADAIATAEQLIAELQSQIDAHRELSSSLYYEA